MTVAQFSATPYEIAKCGDPFALAVWTAFRQYHQINVTGGKWIHNMVFYAKELQMSVETVRRKVQWLIKKGFLKREKRNHYQFGYNYEIPEQWLCLTEEQLKEYRKHKKVKVKMSKESSKKSEAEKPKNFAQNLELSDFESSNFDEGYINKDLIKKEFINKEREILEDEHTHNIDEFQTIEESKPEIIVEKPILKSELTLNNKNLSEDKSSERVAQKEQGISGSVWDGEWKTEDGKYDQEFLEWGAKKWSRIHSDLNTPLKAVNFLKKYYRKDIERVEMDWAEYKEEKELKAIKRVAIEDDLRPEVKAKLEEIRANKIDLDSETGSESLAKEEATVEKVGESVECPVTVSNEANTKSDSTVDSKEETVSNSNTEMTSVECLSKIMAAYKSVPVWERDEKVNWGGMNWDLALGNNYSYWMQLVRGASEGDFASNESLGHDYGVRTVFYRWYKATTEDYSTEESKAIPVNTMALNLLERFKEVFKSNRTQEA